MAAVIYQIAFVLELIVCLVYWSVLYKKDLAKVNYNDGYMFATYFWWHKVLVHTLPALASLINTTITRGVFIPGHALFMIVMGLVYIPINYIGTW